MCSDWTLQVNPDGSAVTDTYPSPLIKLYNMELTKSGYKPNLLKVLQIFVSKCFPLPQTTNFTVFLQHDHLTQIRDVFANEGYLDEVEWIKAEIEARAEANKLVHAKNRAKAMATLVEIKPYNCNRSWRRKINKRKRSELRHNVIPRQNPTSKPNSSSSTSTAKRKPQAADYG